MEKFFKHPRLITAVIGIITLFFALQLPRMELDNNNFRFIPKTDQARITSEYIDDTFGSSLFILVGLERKYGTIFDAQFLSQIKEYIRRIEEIDIVDSVNSIISTDYITGSGDTILVEKLVGDHFDGTPEEIAELKQRLLSWNLYERVLVSDDFTATQIMVSLDIPMDDAGRPDVVANFIKIRDLAREMFAHSAEVYVTGVPVLSATVNEAIQADLILLVPLVIIVVLLILFFSFRRVSAVVLPLLTVLIAVIWSIGAMPLFSVKLSVISTILPVILVAVGSAYGIHVITHYIGDMQLKGAAVSPEEHRKIIFSLLRQIGKPIFLAALTTFVGFASCCFTPVVPIREFGLFSSFGVMVSFAIAVTLIPSLLLIRGPKMVRPSRSGAQAPVENGGYDSLSKGIANAFSSVVRKKYTVLVVTAGLILVSLYGLSQIIADNVMVEYFKSTTDIYRSDRFIREKFGGSKVVSVMIEADKPETILHPDTLGLMEDLNRYLEERVPRVGKVMGFTDMVKRINQVFNADESPEGLSAPVFTGTDGGFGFSQAEAETGTDGFGFDGFDQDGNADENFGFSGGGFGGLDESFGFSGDGAGGVETGDFGTAETSSGGAGPDRAYTPEELAALLDKAASSGRDRSMNANELVREFKRLVNYEGAAYYEVPRDPKRYGKTSPEELGFLVSNYLVLLSGNIEAYANDPLEPTAIKSTVQMRTIGQEDTDEIIGEIHNYVAAYFPETLRVIVGGSALVEGSINRLVVQSQLTSVFISLFAVFLIITLSNWSPVAGLIGIAPLSISILINFAVMGFLGIKLNIGTSMVASISVGIGIDYTIHYLGAYKREYLASGGGKGDFLWRTFATSGKAIIINAVSVGAGFGVLAFSQFNMLGDLGLLIALTMGTSALVSLTVIPVLLTVIKPKFVGRSKK
ncbi:MAG: MMPL family transporter [Spirochaetaceae bacterium]|jgi:predicted RND superfamily exporter protein|nr:MMPL family transporter [Spirochaetaceae bacterium]